MISKICENMQQLKPGSIYVYDMNNKLHGKYNGTRFQEIKLKKRNTTKVPAQIQESKNETVHVEEEVLEPPDELKLSDDQMTKYSLISDNPVYSRLLRNDKNLFYKDVKGKKKYFI